MQRIDLDGLPPAERTWAVGDPGQRGYVEIRIGKVDQYRWYAARIGHGATKVRIVYDERQAYDVIQPWIDRRGGIRQWREIKPAPELP